MSSATMVLNPLAEELGAVGMGGVGYDLHVLESLIRGERAAVATYAQALDRLAGGELCALLSRVRQDHRSAVESLARRLRELGGDPPRTAGAWGALVRALEGGASVLGARSALRVLCAGEYKGLRDYERALEHPALTARTHLLIRDRLIPITQSHVDRLERLP